MKTTDRSKANFERRLQYRDFIYFTEHEKDSELKEMQRFVVPWQMVETKKNKYAVE